MTEEEVNKIIINTLKIYLKIQLKALKNIDHIDPAPPLRQRSGKRHQSIVDLSIDILTSCGDPMHVNDLCERLRKQYGRNTNRDSLSSALAKKARQGILVQQTAPATFGLLPPMEDQSHA